MQIGNRFRCYPTPAQAKTLLQWIGCQRYVYNAKVGEDQYFRRFARKSLAHKGYKLPASLHISIHAGQWHVSFNYDDGLIEPSEKETTDWLMQFDASKLRAMTVGLDRGVALPLAGSDGRRFDLLPLQIKRLAKQEKHKKRWQRRQARRTKGSGNWVKAKRKVARYQRYGGDVRRELAHQTSHVLATDARYKLFVFETLQIKSMTKKAKPKQDEQGRWLSGGRLHWIVANLTRCAGSLGVRPEVQSRQGFGSDRWN